MQIFVNAKNLKQAKAMIKKPMALIVKVTGGYKGFETVDDVAEWLRG